MAELQELTERITPLIQSSEDRDFLSEWTLKRYLKARGDDVDKAFDALKETVEWRREVKIGRLRSTDPVIEMQLHTGKNFTFGSDPEGRPVVYMSVKRDTDPSEPQEKLTYMFFNMERAARYMQAHNITGAIWIVDASGFAMNWLAPARSRMALDLLKALQRHYPEFVYKLFVCHAATVFRMFWKIVLPFLDPVTKSKIIMVAPSELRRVLSEFVPATTLLKEFGGDNTYEFDYETYIAQIRQEEALLDGSGIPL